MHEFSICKNILNLLEQSRRDQGFKRIIKVGVVIGDLAAIDHQSLLFAFEHLCKNTLAEGATLEIKPSAGQEIFITQLEVI